jgi:chaperonin GroES
MKSYRPINDRLVVRPIQEDITSGGVILPDSSLDNIQYAEVLAVGPGLLLISGNRGDMISTVGDIIAYSRMSAKKIDDDENIYVISESEVLTIVSN